MKHSNSTSNGKFFKFLGFVIPSPPFHNTDLPPKREQIANISLQKIIA